MDFNMLPLCGPSDWQLGCEIFIYGNARKRLYFAEKFLCLQFGDFEEILIRFF